METSARPDWLEDNGESPAPTTNGLGDDFGASKPDESAEKSSGSRFACCSFGCVCLNLISITLFVLFVLATIVQTNDADGLQWITFYSINAAIPALFVIHYSLCSCFPVNVIHLLSVIAAIWSIVYIVIASLNLKNTVGGELTEYIFELAGASICLFSSLYHPLMAKRCIKKDAVEDTSGKEIESEELV